MTVLLSIGLMLLTSIILCEKTCFYHSICICICLDADNPGVLFHTRKFMFQFNEM